MYFLSSCSFSIILELCVFTFNVASLDVVLNICPLCEKLTCNTSSVWSVSFSVSITGELSWIRFTSDLQQCFLGASWHVLRPVCSRNSSFHKVSSKATLYQVCNIIKCTLCITLWKENTALTQKSLKWNLNVKTCGTLSQ